MTNPGANTAFDLATTGVAALRMMSLIREFESRLPAFSKEGLIRGSTHPSVGMEAVAVGVSLLLGPSDTVTSNHRGHAHCLAKGADPARTLAEIFGRRDGYCQGRGGSMHIGVRELGVLGTNGVVGAGIGLAVGAALSARLAGSDAVAVAYFGDGATNQGLLAESFNLAAIWRLPVIFVCENNHYAQSSALERMVANPRLVDRGTAYGVPSHDVNGMDVQAVHDITMRAVRRAREGQGPTFIVADTYRFLGHMAEDSEIYRDKAEVERWREHDPIALLAARLLAAGCLSDHDLEDIAAEAGKTIDLAETFARGSPPPDASEVRQGVLEAAS
jgi:pyruvate dehydrogenase E1 component alpha subunit